MSGADGPLVGILVGSESDRERMQPALDELEARGISHELEVRSAHRSPDAVAEYARGARNRGIRVLIAGAGLAAALPGAVAAHTDLPVIGVPLRSSLSVLDGLDALLSIAQMPPGVPVAAVGVDNAKNAAALAARILGSRAGVRLRERRDQAPTAGPIPSPHPPGVLAGCPRKARGCVTWVCGGCDSSSTGAFLSAL
ncbi:MAG TPA: 5-(carboxyamino)imidazole ribonucleotide mutase [Gaiellaceae bacterium]|nr:5-(carboxyamino)imidazole ribonucleotide mutase [Gaiellaceae bacterium]